MREKVTHANTPFPATPRVVACAVALLAAALLVAFVLPATVGAATGAAPTDSAPTAPTLDAATDDAVEVEDGGTYTVGQPLSFAVAAERNGDGFQLRENDSFVAVYEAADGEVIIEDTDGLGPGEYTLEHGNTGEIVYAFTLEPAPETPEPTPTPDPDADDDERAEGLEHRIIWPHDLSRDQRRNALTTTGGLHWIGETLRFEVEDGAFLELRLDGEVVRTMVDDDGEAFLPTSDLPSDTYRVAHEDDDWSFTLGLELQRFAVHVTQPAADGDGTGDADEDGESPALHLDSSRPNYPVTLSAASVSNATLAAAFADAEATEHDGRTVARVDGAGRDTTLPFDPDALPTGEHDLTVHVADAPVSANATVTGTGDVTSAPEPDADADAGGEEPTDTNGTEATDDDGESADDDAADDAGATDEATADGASEEEAPGFGALVTLAALVVATMLAVRRARRHSERLN